MNLKKVIVALGLASTLALTGCGEKEPVVQDMSKVKIGVIAGAEEQVAEIAAKVAKEKFNLDVELVSFSDYISPNAALEDGSIDANAFQHKPYLDQQINDRNYKFAVAGNTFVYPLAAYSKKINALDELKPGDKIAVPNDPTNLGRALLLLEKQQLIDIDDKAGLKATLLDIKGNPNNFEIVELEAPQLPRSLDDVTIAIINNTFASSVNLSPEKDGIFVEDKDSPYVNLIVARQDNVDAPNVQQFVQAYQTEEVYNFASQVFKNSVVKGW